MRNHSTSNKHTTEKETHLDKKCQPPVHGTHAEQCSNGQGACHKKEETRSFTPETLDDIFSGLADEAQKTSQHVAEAIPSMKVNFDHIFDEHEDHSEASAPEIFATKDNIFIHRNRKYVLAFSALLLILVVVSMMMQRTEKSDKIITSRSTNPQVTSSQNTVLHKDISKAIPGETQTGINTPPNLNGAKFIPVILKTGTAMEVHASASDAEGDSVTFSYEWLLNGQYAGREMRITKPFKRGDSISVKITPFDGVDYGKHVELTRDIHNTPPQIIGGKSKLDGNMYSYQLETVDNDHDTLTYALSSAPKGMIIDSSGQITWTVPPEYKGSVILTVTINDGNGGKASQQLTLSIKDLQI